MAEDIFNELRNEKQISIPKPKGQEKSPKSVAYDQ